MSAGGLPVPTALVSGGRGEAIYAGPPVLGSEAVKGPSGPPQAPLHAAPWGLRRCTVTGRDGCAAAAGGRPVTAFQTAPCGLRANTVTGLNGCGAPVLGATAGTGPAMARHKAR